MSRLWPVILAVHLMAASASATVYTVHPDGSGDFPTIQAAIDAAVDNDATVGGGIYLRDANSSATLQCSDLSANGGGNYGGYIFDQTGADGNISEDPLFCGWTAAPPAEIPSEYSLADNFPNPFNPSTEIRFGLPEAAVVSLSIFDVRGRLLLHLIDGEALPAGYKAVTWDGRNALGHSLGSGTYFYRLEAGTLRETRKMILLR